MINYPRKPFLSAYVAALASSKGRVVANCACEGGCDSPLTRRDLVWGGKSSFHIKTSRRRGGGRPSFCPFHCHILHVFYLILGF